MLVSNTPVLFISQAYRHCLPPVFSVPSCLCAIDYVLPPVACWAVSFEVLCAANECFWEHEWDCHGSCSGLSQQDYFQETLNLHSQYDISVGALSCQAHVLFGTATRACVALLFDTEWASSLTDSCWHVSLRATGPSILCGRHACKL